MDSLKEAEGPVRTPTKGTPSILYFIDNIPKNAEKSKFEVVSHFQKRKRFNGGEVVEKEYQAVGPNSALLLFESAEGKLMRLVTLKAVYRKNTVTSYQAWHFIARHLYVRRSSHHENFGPLKSRTNFSENVGPDRTNFLEKWSVFDNSGPYLVLLATSKKTALTSWYITSLS